MPSDTPALDLAASNLTCQLVEIDYIRLILPNFTSWHVIFAKLKLLENTKPSICDTLYYTYRVVCQWDRDSQNPSRFLVGLSLHISVKKTQITCISSPKLSFLYSWFGLSAQISGQVFRYYIIEWPQGKNKWWSNAVLWLTYSNT